MPSLVYSVDGLLGRLDDHSGGNSLYEWLRGKASGKGICDYGQALYHYPNIYEQGITSSVYVVI